MILICDYCKKEYKTYTKPRCEHHYCSKECNYKARNTKIKTFCKWCDKEILVRRSELKGNNFCSKECVNNWQKRNKLELTCKICGNKFYRSPSWLKQRMGYYCSIECRNNDEEWAKKSYIKANQIQCNKKGLNKIELKGNIILDKLDLEYENQYLINNKICVDVYIPEYKLIIQWDGNYWHGKGIKYENLDNRQKHRVDLDKSQDAYFKKCGYNELRFWEDEVMKKENYVYENIKRTIQQITNRI